MMVVARRGTRAAPLGPTVLKENDSLARGHQHDRYRLGGKLSLTGGLGVLEYGHDTANERLVETVLGFFAQQFINLSLEGFTLRGIEPGVPIRHAVPRADDQVFAGTIKAPQGLAGDIARLNGGLGAQLQDQWDKFFRLGVVLEGALDDDFNRHGISPFHCGGKECRMGLR